MNAVKKIGDLLLEKGFIDANQLKQGLKEQAISGNRIGEVLIELDFITEDQLAETISERLGIPKISLGPMVLDPAAVQRVSVDLARRYTLIPIFEIGNTLTLAMADPLNIIAIDEIKYLTGLDIKRAVCTPSEVKAAIDENYSVADSLHHIIGPASDDKVIKKTTSAVVEDSESETPVVKLVNLIIAKAVKDRATDIHIEPEEARLRIRYRIDGIMHEEAAPPKSMQNELVSRIKVSSNLDVSEKRIPQDGRFLMTVDGSNIDLRISTLPTIHGEKIVIRILDRRNLMLTLNQLGFNESTEQAWGNVIRKPEGLILITGPTSSGKTSTLYTTLQEINTVEKNIITVEDPVEYSLPLIIQTQINEKAGLTFPATLRSMLRQNPDIMMIGEIRDTETAQMAVRSALTGHLVFSTIHTNDAPSAVARLIDMGIEPYLVASSLQAVLAQRLVRTNCPECLESYTPSEAVMKRSGLGEKSNHIDIRHGVGCPHCKGAGTKGQTGVYELLEITPCISEMIMTGASMGHIRQEARKGGYRPLFESGVDKLSDGLINLEELLKETSGIDEASLVEEPIPALSAHANPV